jgi:hypothetical protein
MIDPTLSQWTVIEWTPVSISPDYAIGTWDRPFGSSGGMGKTSDGIDTGRRSASPTGLSIIFSEKLDNPLRVILAMELFAERQFTRDSER